MTIIDDKPIHIDDDAIRAKAQSLYRGTALAPMVRASTIPLRILSLQYNADFVYTEELVDRSILETVRVENHELNTIDYIKDPTKLPERTQRKLKQKNGGKLSPTLILRIDPNFETGKLICQLGTGEPDLALAAAKHVWKDVTAVDINMGCPKKFSISGGMGSALLGDPNRAAKIISTLKAEIPIPVSCKIRLLESTTKTIEFIDAMVNAGVNAIAIHARRVGQDSTIPADWKTLEEILNVVIPKYPTIPFLVNGDFYDRQERIDFLQQTKASGVLLARPALYNTSTFLSPHLPLMDKTTIIREYLKLAIRYSMHHKNVKYVICEMMSNRRTPPERVLKLPIDFPEGQTINSTCSNCNDLQSICKVWNLNFEQVLEVMKSRNNISTNQDENKSRTTTTTETLAAGEHKYEDSYFLKRGMDQAITNENRTEQEATPVSDEGISDEGRSVKRVKKNIDNQTT